MGFFLVEVTAIYTGDCWETVLIKTGFDLWNSGHWEEAALDD